MAKGEKVTFAFSVPSATSAWVHGSTWLQEPECKLTGGVEWRERFREATKGCDIRILLYFPDNSPPCISIPHEFLGTQDSEFPIFAALNTSRVWAGLCLYPDCRQSCWPVHLSLHCTAGVAICRGRCSGVSTHMHARSLKVWDAAGSWKSWEGFICILTQKSLVWTVRSACDSKSAADFLGPLGLQQQHAEDGL